MTPDVVSVQLLWHSTAAATDDERYVTHGMPGEWLLEAAGFVPATAVTASDTNYTTISFKQGSTKVLSDRATTVAGTGFTKGTNAALTIREAALASLEFGGNDPLEVSTVTTGTGAVVDGTFTFRFRKVRV